MLYLSMNSCIIHGSFDRLIHCLHHPSLLQCDPKTTIVVAWVISGDIVLVVAEDAVQRSSDLILFVYAKYPTFLLSRQATVIVWIQAKLTRLQEVAA